MKRPGRTAGVAIVIGLLALITVGPAGSARSSIAPIFPSFAGLNYGVPLTASGDWVGTSWLLHWAEVRPQMESDLDFIQAHNLGREVRLFIALDQIMRWDASLHFVGYDPDGLRALSQALDLFDAHQLRVVAVLFDQEVVGSPGNFRFEALDGRHPTLRAGYLAAVRAFMPTIASRGTVAAVDLFNEAYSSLGTSGGLPRPPAADPVSPGYDQSTIHQFLRDLYAAASSSRPRVPITVSDATLYWQPQPDLSAYDDVLDFYDVHVYTDRPDLRNLRQRLDKPYIIGEAGAAVEDRHYTDQSIEAPAVEAILTQAAENGARAVLVHSIASQNVFPASHDGLTPTGQVLATFQRPAAAGDRPFGPL